MIIEVPQDIIDRLDDRLKTMPERAPEVLLSLIHI